MTLEECLRLPAVVLAENFLFLCCCPALPVWPWMERPALKARDKLGLAGTKLHPPVQPFFLLDAALHLHQLLLPPPLPPSFHFHPAAALSDGSSSSCSQLLLDRASCRDSCPGRYSCRPRNPGCSVPAMPALAARQKYGSHCCLPANERRDLPGDQPIRGQESGLLEGSCWAAVQAALAATGRACQHVLQSDPGPRLECPRLSSARHNSLLSDREHWTIPGKEDSFDCHLDYRGPVCLAKVSFRRPAILVLLPAILPRCMDSPDVGFVHKSPFNSNSFKTSQS